MARFNEILVGRYNHFVQKLLSMKGPATMPQIAGEMQPVLAFFNGAENRFLEGWDFFGSAPQQTANAAQNSAVLIRNPTGSNVICVIAKMAVTVGTTQVNANYFTSNAGDLGTIATTRRLDARGRPSAGTVVSNANNVATVAANLFGISQAALGITYDAIVDENQEIMILPGDGILIAAGNNAQLNVWLLWRERFLEESERT